MTKTFLDLTNNITNIFRKFVAEGKCTISFKVPEVDLQIKTDPVQLKAFLNVMKLEMCPPKDSQINNVLKNDNKLIRAFASTGKPIEITTKLTIKERSALPTKGFPRTLKELKITSIGCCRMPIGILNLTNLNSLDLSKNQITTLPNGLGNLKLTTLNLSENRLGESDHSKDWKWLDGDNIRKSLCILNISRNKLKFLPSNIFKCLRLMNFDASYNEISKIPFAIKLMSQLKTLNLSNNKLSSLPYTIIKPNLDVIDLSSNNFPSQGTVQGIIHTSHREMTLYPYRSPSLLELTARSVIKNKIPFMTHNIPLIIKEILFHSPLCANSKCEVLCFDMTIFKNINLIQLNSKQRITSDNANCFNADGPFCSRTCSQAVYKKLFKNLQNI